MRIITQKKIQLAGLLVVIIAMLITGCQANQTGEAVSETENNEAITAISEAASESKTEAAENTTAAGEGASEEAVEEGFRPGKKAYDFELVNLEGETVRLSDYKGKTIVLNFFASWCPPCQVEMPHINAVYNELKDKDVVILGINLTEQDDMNELNALLETNQIAFPILLDEKSEVASLYGIRSIPVNVVINKEGIITEYAIGAVDESRLKGYIEAAQ